MKNQTIHICHWRDIKQVTAYAELVSADDAVIFFGEIDQASAIKIKNILASNTSNIYSLETQQDDHNILKQLSHLQWVDMISQATKTLAWK
ncbi:MAG: hypothetical protein L3J52_02265 [Proteobacteria bacterium]|nr:hypothetical protein [Pseudomonadota bacterium]